MLFLSLSYVDNIVSSIDAIPIVIKGHLTRLARDISALQVLKKAFACCSRLESDFILSIRNVFLVYLIPN